MAASLRDTVFYFPYLAVLIRTRESRIIVARYAFTASIKLNRNYYYKLGSHPPLLSLFFLGGRRDHQDRPRRERPQRSAARSRHEATPENNTAETSYSRRTRSTRPRPSSSDTIGTQPRRSGRHRSDDRDWRKAENHARHIQRRYPNRRLEETSLPRHRKKPSGWDRVKKCVEVFLGPPYRGRYRGNTAGHQLHRSQHQPARRPRDQRGHGGTGPRHRAIRRGRDVHSRHRRPCEVRR